MKQLNSSTPRSRKRSKSIDWIRLPHYLKQTGESRSTFLKLRNEGELVEGFHYQIDTRGRLWVNNEAMMLWVEGETVVSSLRA